MTPTKRKLKADTFSLTCHKNICFSCVAKNPKDKRFDKYQKQRMNRGFDDSETWSLDSVIASFIVPRLKRYKEISCAIPLGTTEKQWDDIIDKIIETFEFIARDDDKWAGSQEENEKILIKIQEGLDLFAKYLLQINW